MLVPSPRLTDRARAAPAVSFGCPPMAAPRGMVGERTDIEAGVLPSPSRPMLAAGGGALRRAEQERQRDAGIVGDAVMAEPTGAVRGHSPMWPVSDRSRVSPNRPAVARAS